MLLHKMNKHNVFEKNSAFRARFEAFYCVKMFITAHFSLGNFIAALVPHIYSTHKCLRLFYERGSLASLYYSTPVQFREIKDTKSNLSREWSKALDLH